MIRAHNLALRTSLSRLPPVAPLLGGVSWLGGVGKVSFLLSAGCRFSCLLRIGYGW